MNKKLLKKVLTAVLTAAMLFTSNGVASLNASAVENERILVEGVYTNFQKATMSTQTSRQIKAYVEPGDATLQRLQYKSSAPGVAKVSNTGLISALSPGKATITVSALDGSKQKETIEITVLNDLTITNKNVDSDNEVIVVDKNLGNLYIDSSVGDADIYLGGVTVRNILALDSGDYSLYMYDSTAKEVKIDEISREIESFAASEEDAKAPNLIIGENTRISDLNARISASIRQEDGSAIEGLRVTQTEDGRITVYLDNYTGGLLLDASLGNLEIVTSGCSISNVNVSGGNEKAGNVQLTNGGNSQIENLTLSGAANVNLGIPANQVNIEGNASGASFNSSASIGILRNTGSRSNITISASVENLETDGENGNINVVAGAYIGTANLNGAGTSLSGSGEVAEANINANNVSVDTVNTLVTVGEVRGAKIQGKDAAPGSTVATVPVAGGGGGAGGSDGPDGPEPEKPVVIGEVIISNNFNDDISDLQSVQGDVKIGIIDSGDSERGKVAFVSNKSASWAGAGVNLSRYTGQYISIGISAKIKTVEAGAVKVTIKYNGNQFTQPEGCEVDAKANSWTELSGTFLLDSTIESAVIYFEAPGNYYLDDVLITVVNIGEPIAAETVTIDQTELTLNRNESKKLTATVLPGNADVRTVTWSSSDPEVATVDENGIVTGVKAGKATITATSKCPYADEAPVATSEVEVMDVVVINLNKNYIFFTAEGETETLTASEIATWISSDDTVATVSDAGVVTAVGNGIATITGNIPGGIGTCTVKVELQPEGAFVFDYDDEEVGDVKNFQGSGKATIALDPTIIGTTNRVLKVEPSNYSQFSYVEITLPDGKRLGDYTSLAGKIHLAQGDVGDKRLVVLAGKNLSELSLSHEITPSQIGESGNYSKNATFESLVAEFKTMSTTLSNLTGKIVLGFGVHCAGTVGDLSTIYYLDELVLVPYTGDPVAVEEVTLNKSTLSLVEGRTEQLTATIIPVNYTTSVDIAWSSSKEEVATVDANGKVTAVKEGNTTITVTVTENSENEYKATCVVTVTEAPADPAGTVKVNFESDAVDTPYNMMGWSLDDGSAKVVQLSDTNKVLEVKPTNYNNAAIISITLPEGKTLGDYSDISYKAYWKQGDIGWKDVVAEAGVSLDGGFNPNDPPSTRIIAKYYRNAGATTELMEETIPLVLDETLSALSGTIEIALGISCAAVGEGDGLSTVYYLDDIELVPKEDISAPETIINFDNATIGSVFDVIGWNPDTSSATIVAVSGSAIQALEVKPSNYNTAAVIQMTLASGFTLNDYKAISFKVYLKSGDVAGKWFRIEAAEKLMNQFDNGSNPVIGESYRDAGKNDDFELITINLDDERDELPGTFEFAIGISCAADLGGEPTIYYIDDITFIP